MNLRKDSLSDSAPVRRQAELQLDFIIIGGNLGGLACAYALASAGHKVRVLEKNTPDMPTSWSGVHIPPNMSKILDHWGIGLDQRAKSLVCSNLRLCDLETNEYFGNIPRQSALMNESGGDNYFIHHRYLYEMLSRIAKDAGAEIRCATEVADVFPGHPRKEDSDSEMGDYTPSLISSHSSLDSAEAGAEPYRDTCLSVTGYGPPSVVLVNGDILTADIVIGLDGQSSLVRNVVLQPEDDHGRHPGREVFSTTYTRDQITRDPLLRDLANGTNWDAWMGNGGYAHGHSTVLGKEYIFRATWPSDRVPKHFESEKAENWECSYPHELFAEMLRNGNASPELQTLSKIPSKVSRARYLELPRCEQWFHESGTIVIMGDAAHPNLPCSQQSTAMVMEDVAVFGGLFSRLRSWDQVPSLMAAFQELRQARTESVAQQDMSNAEFCSIPPGPDRDERNEGIRRNANIGLEGWDDERLQSQWDEIGSVYSYSAMDACDEWWYNWGMLGEMAKMRRRDQMEINVSVIPRNTRLIPPLSDINKRTDLVPH